MIACVSSIYSKGKRNMWPSHGAGRTKWNIWEYYHQSYSTVTVHIGFKDCYSAWHHYGYCDSDKFIIPLPLRAVATWNEASCLKNYWSRLLEMIISTAFSWFRLAWSKMIWMGQQQNKRNLENQFYFYNFRPMYGQRGWYRDRDDWNEVLTHICCEKTE